MAQIPDSKNFVITLIIILDHFWSEVGRFHDKFSIGSIPSMILNITMKIIWNMMNFLKLAVNAIHDATKQSYI